MCGGHEILGYAWRGKQFMALQFTGSGFQHFCDHMHVWHSFCIGGTYGGIYNVAE